ncbi:hypothetical protein TNCV_1189671 [Trichonephila clavipes]|nr:hypothetical protein TNCV_1189671 [Trichonephila clavipes]
MAIQLCLVRPLIDCGLFGMLKHVPLAVAAYFANFDALPPSNEMEAQIITHLNNDVIMIGPWRVWLQCLDFENLTHMKPPLLNVRCRAAHLVWMRKHIMKFRGLKTSSIDQLVPIPILYGKYSVRYE